MNRIKTQVHAGGIISGPGLLLDHYFLQNSMMDEQKHGVQQPGGGTQVCI